MRSQLQGKHPLLNANKVLQHPVLAQYNSSHMKDGFAQ